MTNVRVVIVGEAWGRKEEMFGHAFIGGAGRELAKMLAEAGLAPANDTKYPSELEMIAHWKRVEAEAGIVLDNVFHAHPTDNKIELFFDNAVDGDRTLPPYKIGSSTKYLRKDMRPHVEGLWARLSTAKPNLVLAFGNTACWATIAQTKITVLRGTVQMSSRLGLKVLPTYHPAAILRNWPLRIITVADLKKAVRELEFPEIRRPDRWITTHNHQTGERLTLSEIEDWLSLPAESYAVDVESGYALYSKAELKRMTPRMLHMLGSQISIVGFASRPDWALSIPFMDRTTPDLSYWSPNDEVHAWELVRRGLQKPIPKIFQNGNYDVGQFMSMGIVPVNCIDDTMLRHHSIYPELLKNLGFLGSIYANEVSWKQMYTNRESLKRDE